MWIDKNGQMDKDYTGGTQTFNDYQEEYFTDLHKYHTRNREHSKLTRVSFKSVTESYVYAYVNPAPQCYPERYLRDDNGEIFIGGERYSGN